jgi:hypothetical protein
MASRTYPQTNGRIMEMTTSARRKNARGAPRHWSVSALSSSTYDSGADENQPN